jgi:hypothetical protein
MVNFTIIDLTHTSRFSAALAVAVFAATAWAQTTTPTTTPSPCPSTTAPVLQSFSVENVLLASQILSTMTPTLPTGISSAVGASALEIRQSATYNTTNQLITLNLFTAQPGSPLPTPTGTIVPSSIFSILSVKVDKVYTSCSPNSSVMLVGTVATNTPPSPFGNLAGAPAALSVGLSNDTPPKITNVVTLFAGSAVEYAASGGGTITFTAGPVTPPGSGGGPTIVVAPAGPTSYSVVTLDASGTTSANTPLTFLWSVVSGSGYIGGDPTKSIVTAYLQGGAGIYTFRVTITDSKGNVSKQDVPVQFF